MSLTDKIVEACIEIQSHVLCREKDGSIWYRAPRKIVKKISLNAFKVRDAFNRFVKILSKKDVDIYGVINSNDVFDYNSGIEHEPNFEKRMLKYTEYNFIKKLLTEEDPL